MRRWFAVCVVVIVIAGTYCIALFFAKSRETARKGNCLSNMKGISLAILGYMNDYDGTLPFSANPKNDAKFEVGLGKLSMRYMRRTYGRSTLGGVLSSSHDSPRNLLRCPSDTSSSRSEMSYQYKHAVNMAARAGCHDGDFDWSGDQVLLYERRAFHDGGGPIVDGAEINVACLDGHAMSVRMTDVRPDAEPRYFNTVHPSAPDAIKKKRPYWNPNYCYDTLQPQRYW